MYGGGWCKTHSVCQYISLWICSSASFHWSSHQKSTTPCCAQHKPRSSRLPGQPRCWVVSGPIFNLGRSKTNHEKQQPCYKPDGGEFTTISYKPFRIKSKQSQLPAGAQVVKSPAPPVAQSRSIQLSPEPVFWIDWHCMWTGISCKPSAPARKKCPGNSCTHAKHFYYLYDVFLSIKFSLLFFLMLKPCANNLFLTGFLHDSSQEKQLHLGWSV